MNVAMSHIPCVSRHTRAASLYLASSHSDSASGCRDPYIGRRNSDCAATLQDRLVEAFSLFLDSGFSKDSIHAAERRRNGSARVGADTAAGGRARTEWEWRLGWVLTGASGASVGE